MEMDMDEECWSCGYSLIIHTTPENYSIDGTPDPNGGCPVNENDAIIRWGV
jgi:hypothetical protein